jgi:hypothetical protein
MKKVIPLLFIVLLIFSCARKYSITNTFSKGIPAGMQQWVLDSTYHLYIREVFLDTTDPGDKAVKNATANFNTAGKLIEVEYLLFSQKNKRAVYIASIPDKYLSYYAKKIKYLKREYINAYDFSTFRFGIKSDSSNTIVFNNSNTQHSDAWHYTMDQDSILHVYQVVERINDNASNVYLVDEALSRNASFVRTDSFAIVFRNMDKEKKVETKRGRPPLQRFCKDNIIYYQNSGNKYNIYFRFDKSLPPRYKDSAIGFGNSRLVNTPFK